MRDHGSTTRCVTKSASIDFAHIEPFDRLKAHSFTHMNTHVRHLLTFLLAVGSAMLAAQAHAAPARLYVSPQGNNTWSGTCSRRAPLSRGDGPFRTLARARDEVRALRQAGKLPHGAVVELMPGLYELDAPFGLTAEDSGAESASIVYRARERGTAVISGAVALTDWQPVTDRAVLKLIDPAARGKIVWTFLDAGLLDPIPGFSTGGSGYRGTRQYPIALFQNGERLPISRWPNDGYVKTGECLGESEDWGRGIKFTEGIFRFEDERLARWVGEPDLWFDGLWYWHWADQKMALKAIDRDAQTIALQDPESNYYGFRKGQEFYVFNAIAEIDRPGEWAVDRANRRIYLWPATDLRKAVPVVTLRESLIQAEKASHITFDGLVLEGCRKTAVTVRDGQNVKLVGCTLRHINSWGVDFDGGSECAVIGCDLYDLGEGGVKATGGVQDTLTPGNHLIENNHIHHFGLVVHTSRYGAVVYGVGNAIRHNLIHHAQHTALFFRGNDHLIEYNIIHDVCLHSSDAGALRACARDWSLRGVVIRHNLIHATGKGIDSVGCFGIYLDDFTSGATVVGNICSMVGYSVLTCGNGNRIENNLSINSRKSSFYLSSRGIDSFAKSIAAKGRESRQCRLLLAEGKPYRSELWRNRYPHLTPLLDMIEKDPIGAHDAHFCTMRNNINVGGIPVKVRNAEKVMRTGTFENNINLHEDPGFVDLAGFDLRLRPDAIVFKKLPDFRPLEFEKMGLYADPLRASPAVKFGKGVTPMPEIQPRIAQPELKPR